MNWDDLRYILAVARHGTISEGARALRVNTTTVSRRLRAMEEEAGTALFKKFKHGVVLTDAGEQMVGVAEEVEGLTNSLDARIHGLDTALKGQIRVTSIGMIFNHWMADFGEFQRRYPDIDLELLSGFEVSNLTQREADIAIRIAPKAPDHLIGRKFAELLFATYGSRELVESVGADAPYDAFPWLSWDLAFGRGTDDWLAKNAPDAHIVMRVDKMSVMVSALDAGLGITILPCFVADTNPRLRRVGAHFEGGTFLWVLTHPQLRGAARIKAFTGFVRALIARDKDLLEGRRPLQA